jgi:hypothetical protein
MKIEGIAEIAFWQFPPLENAATLSRQRRGADDPWTTPRRSCCRIFVGHGFSRAVKYAESIRLQPLACSNSSCQTGSTTAPIQGAQQSVDSEIQGVALGLHAAALSASEDVDIRRRVSRISCALSSLFYSRRKRIDTVAHDAVCMGQFLGLARAPDRPSTSAISEIPCG